MSSSSDDESPFPKTSDPSSAADEAPTGGSSSNPVGFLSETSQLAIASLLEKNARDKEKQKELVAMARKKREKALMAKLKRQVAYMCV